ncbi:MAG: HAD family phosphatase [Vicinamibacterales bacterium]
MSAHQAPVAAIILDMDGLMVDTEPLYKTAWQAACTELGFDLNDERYAKIVGRPLPDCERVLAEEFGPTFSLDALRARWPAIWRDEVGRLGIARKPGLTELLVLAREQKLDVAVATSTNADWANSTLERAGLAKQFDVIVTGDQIAHGKPAPDIYLEAARRLGVAPSACVAIEDSEAGIQSIAAAGMIGILVPHWPASAAARAAAHTVVPSLHDASEVISLLLAPAGMTH